MATNRPVFPPDRITPPVRVDWEATLPALPDPGFAGAVFVIIKDGVAQFRSENYIAERVAEIWTGEVDRADAWDILLIKTNRMQRLEVCTLEADPRSRRPTAVFRGSDGYGHFAMNI